jgi:glutamate-ammonia-ligase adenylyltransferase
MTQAAPFTDWLSGWRWAGRLDGESLRRIEALASGALDAAGASLEPELTRQRAGDLLEQLALQPELLARIAPHPEALRRAVTIIGASPALGHFLIGQPEMLQALLPGRALAAPSLDTKEARARLDDALDRSTDEESALVALRAFKWGHVLPILAADLEGALSLDQVSHALSDLADLILTTVVSRVSASMGLGGDSPIGVICYGKLGSREMSYASDTDIVFVYDQRRGFSPEDLTRLAGAVNHWLTAHTVLGALYATDFRLRPHGDSGQLVSSLGAFRHYQMSSAWTWEHQALTRARWLACDPDLGQALRDVRVEVLRRPRDPDQLRTDVLSMRDRLFKQSSRSTSGAFDVKHGRGGVIDVEFIVQYLILRHASANPALCDVGDNSGALALGASLGLLPGDLARAVGAAYRQYRLWMHRERLRGNETVVVAPEAAADHRRAVMTLWGQVFAP